LIKLLAQQEKLTAGEYRLGHEVHLDYFAQDQYKELDPEARILDDLGELSGASTQTELRGLLGCFCSRATTCSSASAFFPEASATATLC